MNFPSSKPASQRPSAGLRRPRPWLVLLLAVASSGYVINNWWPDGDNIVMDDIFLPAATWSSPAQFQMSEWNTIDTTDNSHPFRVANSPQFSFGANDGDNSMGFLGEAGLSSEYGLSYSNALAWAICWTPLTGSRYDECDVVLDPTLPWSLNPDNNEWFQSTVLHELGHVRGLGHYNGNQSMQNSGQSKYLRGETLYMDDKVGVRQHASHITERDIAIYNKWHDGSVPRWMTMSPTTVREGGVVDLNDIKVENLGTLAFGSTVRFGTYLSTNDIISTGDTLLNTGSFGSFGTFTQSTFDWQVTIPTQNDCGTRWIGGIIDDNGAWSERYEGNNAVAFTNGNPYSGSSYQPTSINVLLAEDGHEPNDSRGAAPTITLPFSQNGLSIDTDSESDYYRVVLSRAGEIDILVDFQDSLGDVDLQLQSSTGTVLASSTSATDDESITRHLTAGTYYVRVFGFGSGSCNRYDLDVTFDPDLADLRVTSMTAPSAAVPGATIPVTSTVRNLGVAGSSLTRVAVYLSTNSICSTLDTFLGSRTVSSLAVSGTSSGTTNVVVPGLPSGDYWLCSFVDDTFSVEEELENNNTLVEGFQVALFTDSFESGDTSAWSFP